MAWQFMSDFWFDVTFVFSGLNSQAREDEGGAKELQCFLVGDFCGWKPDAIRMSRCEEGFSTNLLLGEGFYEYKFLASDGRWFSDERNPHRSQGPYGNSLLFVHMDPGVYGMRPRCPPHREYHRPNSDGAQFQILCPTLPPDIASEGILQRDIFVYLPPSYHTNHSACHRYPVLYAHDGQNLFSTPGHAGGPPMGGWYLDAKLDHWWSEGMLPEFIVVAVPNSDFVCIGNRQREYCPADFLHTHENKFFQYLKLIKASVDERFHTLPDATNTVTLGSSMGGLLAFVLALAQPDTFSCGLCLSPSFWYCDRNNHTAYDLARSLKAEGCTSRVYIDSGCGLGDNKHETQMMKEVLLDNGWVEGKNFGYHLDQSADTDVTHTESVWKERVHIGLKFAFRN